MSREYFSNGWFNHQLVFGESEKSPHLTDLTVFYDSFGWEFAPGIPLFAWGSGLVKFAYADLQEICCLYTNIYIYIIDLLYIYNIYTIHIYYIYCVYIYIYARFFQVTL